jgi:hypothetical protein
MKEDAAEERRKAGVEEMLQARMRGEPFCSPEEREELRKACDRITGRRSTPPPSDQTRK